MANCDRKAFNFYSGVDLHKKKSYVYIVDKKGDKVKSIEIDTIRNSFEDVFAPYVPSGLLVAVEISSFTFWLCDILNEKGIGLYVVNTLENHYLSRSLKKTDKEDARKLAFQLWNDILPRPVYIPKKEERDLRNLVSHRHFLVKHLTRVVNRTGYVLANYEIKFNRRVLTSPKKWQQLSESFEGGYNPAKITLPREPMKVDPLLFEEFAIQYAQFKLYKEQISRIEKGLQSHLEQTPRFNQMYELLLTIPGMGPVTSSALIGCIGDIERFESGRQLVSYLGLCPKIRESAGKSLTSGGITKKGNSRLRGYFVQAAIALLGSRNLNSKPLKEWYERIRKKKGWRTARVALARKLATIAFGVLKTSTPYDPLKVAIEKNTDAEANPRPKIVIQKRATLKV